jgi:hypothetical protein
MEDAMNKKQAKCNHGIGIADIGYPCAILQISCLPKQELEVTDRKRKRMQFFAHCPYCGVKLNWKAIREIHESNYWK